GERRGAAGRAGATPVDRGARAVRRHDQMHPLRGVHDGVSVLLGERPVRGPRGDRQRASLHLRLARPCGTGASRHPEQQDGCLALPHDLQLHGRLPARDPDHEGDRRGEAGDPLRRDHGRLRRRPGSPRVAQPEGGGAARARTERRGSAGGRGPGRVASRPRRCRRPPEANASGGRLFAAPSLVCPLHRSGAGPCPEGGEMATPRPKGEPEFEGGAQPVPERPPDEPGRGRGALLTIVAVLAFLLLLMPVLWALGAIATIGRAAGTAGRIILWITWALVCVAFAWLAWSMWRRSA